MKEMIEPTLVDLSIDHRAAAPADYGLIVEDEEGVADLLADLLGLAGLRARRCEGLAGTLEAFGTVHPRIVFLDLSLPSTDAVEMIRRFAEAGTKAPVVLMSGMERSTLEHVQRIGQRYGLTMLDFLCKPFTAADVRQRIGAAGIVMVPARCEERVCLENALDRRWLEVWYQPKVDLSTMRICGAEALVRLRHPDHGLLSPGSFLPRPGHAAFKPLTEFVIGRAMGDWDRFADAGLPIKLAVNVPIAILEHEDFVPLVRSVTPRRPDFPGFLVELTEDDLVRDPARAEEAAIQLKLQKVDVAIDDFGQGYSSLLRLTQIPFVELKLDRSFVDGCSKDRIKAALAQTVVDLARRIGCSSVAEGVESQADLRALSAMKCDMAQGYLFARPMPLGDFVTLLKSHASGSQTGVLPEMDAIGATPDRAA